MMTNRERLKQQIDTLSDEQIDQITQLIKLLQTPQPQTPQSDPLIGLFSSSPDLATHAGTILQQEIHPTSGWTWKPFAPNNKPNPKAKR
jgi:hypothetical protein